MFNPNEHLEQCERYMSRFLGSAVKLIRAEALQQSTREAPWRLDVRVDGVEQVFVLQVDPRGMEYEYQILKAVESIPIRTPRAYGLDMQGEALGVPCFFSDFIEGESLLGSMLAGEAWAEELYFDTVCALQAVTEKNLGDFAPKVERISLADMIDEKYARLKAKLFPLADAAYKKLKEEMPAPSALRFSNGDLWLDNFIARDGKLAGVIDFQNAAFSDPLFEFLLSFFVEPKLQGRGMEERFCQRIGMDPAVLHWYCGLEYFDVLPWLLETGKTFVHHTAESAELNLQKWLDGDSLSG
jgi:aminoglycoside phosphotransferase (APT) family kinase protein